MHYFTLSHPMSKYFHLSRHPSPAIWIEFLFQIEVNEIPKYKIN
jgi:hypothetical protein